jgi:two-component system aerobic respiration control sensor histidine kinase ArcB
MDQAGKKMTNQTSLKHILIVEDSSIAQKSQRLLFESFGLTVDIAADGGQAMALFKLGKYAIVLINIGLPDMSGYEVCKRLIALEEGSNFHAPMIGISAHVTPEKNELALQAGMKEILPKPLLIEQANVLLQRYAAC